MKAMSQRNCGVVAASDFTVRVLLLEESADSQDALEELRAAGMTIEPTVLATRREFVEAIASQDFSIALSEYTLPGWRHLRNCRRPRNRYHSSW
jgi:CheY-like chemotaxis protein